MQSVADIVVLISGRGSNLKSLLDQQESYRIRRIISDRPEAGGLAYGKQYGIPTSAFARKDFPDIASLKAAIFAEAAREKPDFICLAGFMLIVPPSAIARFPRQIINIHPSLLPQFPGLHTHERVIAAQESRHGCSVHLVDEGVDTGAIIAQAEVAVAATDTPESLGAKVLAREHALYPWIMNSLGKGEIRIETTEGVEISGTARQQAVDLGFCGGALTHRGSMT